MRLSRHPKEDQQMAGYKCAVISMLRGFEETAADLGISFP